MKEDVTMDNGLECNLYARVSKIEIYPHCKQKSIHTHAAVECDQLGYLTNGNVVLSGFTFMNNATYNCSEGYTLNGSAVRMCNATGHWVPEEPACDCKYICKIWLKQSSTRYKNISLQNVMLVGMAS